MKNWKAKQTQLCIFIDAISIMLLDIIVKNEKVKTKPAFAFLSYTFAPSCKNYTIDIRYKSTNVIPEIQELWKEPNISNENISESCSYSPKAETVSFETNPAILFFLICTVHANLGTQKYYATCVIYLTDIFTYKFVFAVTD